MEVATYGEEAGTRLHARLARGRGGRRARHVPVGSIKVTELNRTDRQEPKRIEYESIRILKVNTNSNIFKYKYESNAEYEFLMTHGM